VGVTGRKLGMTNCFGKRCIKPMNNKFINLQYTTIKTALPDFIYGDLRDFVKNINLYQPQPKILVEKLAKKHHLPCEMIYLTAGIDEAIQMFILAYGENTFVFTPTYIVYRDVLEYGKKLNTVFSIRGMDFVIETKNLPEATLICLPNPNNPLGFTAQEKVLELVGNNSQAIVVVDEAYGEFAHLSVINEVKNYPNLAVFRSFSKAYGMAGVRVGYIIASPKIIAKVKNKTQWSNVSYLAVGAAVSALEHEEYFSKMREEINESREGFVAFLHGLNFKVFPSKINAVLLKFSAADCAYKFFEHLKKENIIVSRGNGNSNFGLDDTFVRIAIGNQEQMEKVRQVIADFKVKFPAIYHCSGNL